MTTTLESLGAGSTMREVLEAYPGAQRALFRRYHIGGCSSCGFQPSETLEQLCVRNNNLEVKEVIERVFNDWKGALYVYEEYQPEEE